MNSASHDHAAPAARQEPAEPVDRVGVRMYASRLDGTLDLYVDSGTSADEMVYAIARFVPGGATLLEASADKGAWLLRFAGRRPAVGEPGV
jgi:hypothetical protein